MAITIDSIDRVVSTRHDIGSTTTFRQSEAKKLILQQIQNDPSYGLDKEGGYLYSSTCKFLYVAYFK